MACFSSCVTWIYDASSGIGMAPMPGSWPPAWPPPAAPGASGSATGSFSIWTNRSWFCVIICTHDHRPTMTSFRNKCAACQTNSQWHQQWQHQTTRTTTTYLTALYPQWSGWAGTRTNIHSLTPCLCGYYTTSLMNYLLYSVSTKNISKSEPRSIGYGSDPSAWL